MIHGEKTDKPRRLTLAEEASIRAKPSRIAAIGEYIRLTNATIRVAKQNVEKLGWEA